MGEISGALEEVFTRHRAEVKAVSGVYGASYQGDEDFTAVSREVAAFAKAEGRQPRMLVVKLGQDGHDRGMKVIATAFADLGFDVDVGPLFQTPEEAARQAIDNDVHVVGVSSQAAGHKTLVPELVKALAAQGAPQIAVVVGGIIPPRDYAFLRESGVAAVFGPGTAVPKAAREVCCAERWAERAVDERERREIRSARGLGDAIARAGDRRAIARTITLLESTRADRAERGQQILDALVSDTGGALRVGITGPPGVGKSTFIESLGLHLLDAGHRVAVLAVDPSSPVTRGSILGDKTRMERLAQRDEAFIRPSPSGGTLGGVAQRTRECMLVCEAAGYDVVIVETVGIGQSEVTVAGMVDFFLVLLQPGSGDELQGIKKGVLELADGLVVNKADGDGRALAERARHDYERALSLLRPLSPSWKPRVLAASGLTGEGVDATWQMVLAHRDALRASGEARGAPPRADARLDVEPGRRGPRARVPVASGGGRADPRPRRRRGGSAHDAGACRSRAAGRFPLRLERAPGHCEQLPTCPGGKRR